MKRSRKTGATFAAILLALLLSSCASTKLYSWYNYQADYYHYVKNNDKKTLDDLVATYEKVIATQKATRGVVPPGIYADYGFLLIQNGKTTEGKAMLAKELELYPESKVFVGSILKRIK